MAQFKKGSLKERLYNSILKSAMGTLIKADTFHNFVMPGSTADNLKVTAAGGPIVESIKSGVSDVAGSIINTIVGDPGTFDMKDQVILYNNDGEGTYRVSFKTIAGLIAAEAVQNASGEGGILTATSLWSLLMSDSDYQIDISHMRDALKNYLTKEDVQGMFRSGGHNDYISKIFDDEALGLITFLSGLRSNGVAYLMKGLQIGRFQAGITGFGAKVDSFGNGEFESLIVRRFLEVPELRYNRVEILAGDSWRAPGGGIIESVTVNSDGLTGKATLKLEEGEIGNIAVNDICMGIFHDYDNTNVNATETTDDGFGNRTFAGFCTAYFRITSIDAVTEVDGIKYYNKTFNYAIRPTSARWNHQMHPCQFMTFVAYGNFTNTQRQNATYETPAYTRMLRGQNSWEIAFNNIGMQFGDCNILANFDTQSSPNPRAREASTFLFYIDGDIMHTGVLRRVDPHGRDIVDYYDQGEWDPLTEYFYKDRVSHNGSLWLCVHEDTIDEHGVIHGLIGDEPGPNNPNWLALVYADSIVSMGHWKAEECPYRAQTIVNLGGILYLSKVETSNPPRGLLTGKQNDGKTYYLKDNKGMYLMTNDNTISDDWDLLIDISESVMGEDAIYINLTNDSDSIESDENGIIPAGAQYPTTKAQLYKGSTQITSGITWAVSAVGCSATIAPESGVVATSAMTADKATVTIYATYNNVTYTKIFTFGKLFGANKLILSPSADVIKYDPNTQTFEPEILVMRAYMVKNGERTEITSTNNLGYIYLNGNTAQKYYSGMSVNTNNLQAFANGRIKFELFDSQDHIGDMEEIPLVQDGIDGAGNVVINLTNDSDSIVTDSDGNIDPNETYPTTTAELYVDMEKIPDTDVTWNCAGSGCQAVIDEHGVVTTSNMTADVATVTIIGTYVVNGRSYYKVFKFRKLFGAEKYYLQCSHNVIIRDQNGSYTPNSITVRAYCKRFGEDPVECTQAANLGKIVYAGQAEPQFSPVVHVITGSSFTDRHLVFTLIDNNNKIQDTEDIPLVWDGKDGQDGQDGKGFANKGHWDSEEEYEEGDVVQLGNQYFTCVIPNHGKPPRAILCDGVSGKYLTNEDGGYFPVGEEFDDTYWETFFRDGRDGIDGQDGRDGRDGQDGDTPVFINLTNDSDSVVTDSDGNPLESLPTTVAQFFYGSRQLFSSDGVVWGTDHVVGCQVNFNQDGEYEVTAMSADRAQVVIKATYNGMFYLRTFSFVKLYGQDKYVVEPEVGTVQYNPENGTFTPTRLALYAYVIKNGQFQSVTQASGLGYIKVGDSATRRYNGDEIVTADFFSVSGVEVSLIDNDGNVKDKEYIPRVSDGRNGQPGSDAIMIQFDDSNVHFLCDAEGVPVAGQAYTVNSSLYIGSNLSPLKSMEGAGGCSVVSNMVGDRPAISFTAQITGTHNDNLQIAINGFDTNAPDNNKLTVTLVSENGQHTRIGVISVDKVRPGKDGKSPIVYNVVPGVNTIKKNGSAYAPTVLTAAVRKSYVDNGAIYNQMLDPLDAFTYEGIKIYYALDKVMTSPAMADGEVPDAGITLAANSVNQYIHLAIAKANGIFVDKQTVAILQDGTSPIVADLDNEMDSVACDVDMHPERNQSVSTNVDLYHGSTKQKITRVKILKGSDIVYDSTPGSSIVPITGVTFNVSIGQVSGASVSIVFGTTATLDDHTNYDIEIHGTIEGQDISRYLTLTVNGMRPGLDGSPASIFQLVPSVKSVSKYKDGTYSETQLTCSYTKNVGGEYITPVSGGTIVMRIDGRNNEVPYRALVPGTDFESSVLYLLYVDGGIVDKENIIVVSDGRDGVDGDSISKTGESYQYATNNTGVRPAQDSTEWKNTKPTLQEGYWLYTKITISWSDGSNTILYTDSRNPNDGKDGQDIVTGATVITYCVTDNNATQPADDQFKPYNEIVSQIVQGKWLWNKATTPYYKSDDLETPIGYSSNYGVTYISKDGINGTNGVDGTSPYFADLDNEMDSIACTHEGKPSSEQTVETNVSLYHGSTKLSSSITVHDDSPTGAAYTNGTAKNGITVTWNNNTGNIKVKFSTSPTLVDVTTLCITLTYSDGGFSVIRDLYFKVNGVRASLDGKPAEVYRLVPSISEIVKKKDNSYVPDGNTYITCNVTKNVGGTQSTPASSEYSLKYILNGGSETTYTATSVKVNQVTSSIVFILRVNNVVVDRETISLVSDGTDGTNGRAITGTSEHYKASNKDGSTGHKEQKPTSDAQEWSTNPNVSDWGENKRYLWNYERVEYTESDGTITVERTDPRIIAIWTKDGRGIDSITNYWAISNSGTVAPVEGWDDDPIGPTEEAPYLWNYEHIAYTDGTSEDTDRHVIGHYGKDGRDGVDGTSIVNMGHWHSGVDYPVGAWVEFMGAIYRCIQACGNVPPKVCLTDGEHFLVNKGYYIVACPEVANSAYWVEDIPAYPDVARLDLDNENDSILYDGGGNKISASPVSHASLYVNGEERLDNITLTANWVNCSGTVSGKTITVNDVTGDNGYVEVSTVFNGATYKARMNVVKIIGTDKYDIILSSKSVHVETNITPNTYIPQSVTVDVLITSQNQEPRLATSADMVTAGLMLYYQYGEVSPHAMDYHEAIPKSVFEQASNVIVTLKKDGLIIDQETIPVVKDGVNGTSPIVADLDNEMDSIACDVNMHPSPDDQTVITHVVMLHGSTPQSIKSLKLYKNNTEVTTGGGISVNITGVNTTEGTITMVFSEEATLEDVNNYEIRVVSTINAVDERRSLNFVVNGIRPGADGAPAAVYNLQPSKSQIVKRKNGSYSVASLNCTYSKVVGGNAVEPATGGTIKAILDNSGSEVTNRAFVPGTDFNSEVLYLLYVGGKVVDKESVPIVEDGEDGEDGKGFVDCGDWDSETEYNPGDVVHFAGEMFVCVRTTRNAPYGLLKGLVNGSDDVRFLKDANGGYIIVDDSELTDDWSMFMASPDPTCRIDLDNENDSILYDNVGRNITGNCFSNVSFYIGYQKFSEKVTFNITPNGCTATLNDNRIEVSDVSGDVGTVTVTCVYKGETYQAIMNIKRLVGVNKYDIRLSASSLQYNPDTQRYSDTGIKVDVIRTSQKDSKIVLNADAFTSGPEAGYVLRWKKASDANYTNINPRTVIANTDFNKEDVYVELLDNTGLVLDSETIPFVSSGGSSFRIDLSNENDSILYDNVGRNISGSVSTAVNLYLGNQPYNEHIQFTYAATGCTATLSGNVITVSNVNDDVDVGQVVVTAVFQGNTYRAIMSVKKLVGVNKYDLQFGHSVMSYDTDNKTYANSNIQVDVIRTSAMDGRTRLASDAFGTGKPEAGYVLRYFTANDLTTPAGTINPRGTIPSSAWTNGDVLVQLLDDNNLILDSETIPLVKSGSSVLRLDLNNEHDSILYDNNGKKISGNVSTKATLYKGSAPYSGTLTYTAVATDCTLASGSASNTTGNVTVIGINAGKTSGKVVISCVLDGVTYSATFTITRLSGVNKYDLVLSASEMKRDPNNANAYDPSGGITVDVYRTNLEGTRTRLASNAFNSGNDEAGYSLTYTTAGGSETTLNPRSVVPASAFSGGDVLVTLKDNNSKILDTESIPLLIQGLNGPGAQYIMIKGGCHAEDGYTPSNSGGSITVYDGKNTTTLTDTDMAADATTGKRRGLALVLVKRDTLAMSHKKFYDVYDPTYGNTRCNKLANQIHNATNEYFIAIFSYDAIGFNTDLIIRLREAGSVGLHWYGPDRRPFSFLGYNGLPEGNALQNLGEKESHATADVMTYITNGSFGANPDAVRYYIETNPSALIKTSGNTWVSSGNITIKVYKQKGSQDPIPAVQGDIFARYVTDTGVEGQITIQSGTGTGTIAVNTLSASIKYITIYIAHENSNSANRLDSVTIPVIANGAPGYEGCQVRVTKWEDKAQNPNRLTFHNDRGTNGAFKIVDVIGVPWKQGIKDMVTGNTISEKPSSGYLWYLCEAGHTQADTYEQERTSYGGSSGKWSAMSDLGPTFVTLLVAQYAKIEFGTTNEFLFVNSRDEVVGGFSGTIDNENEDNSIRIWAGRALPTENWSYTMPSHVTGKYLWGRLEVYKGNSTTVTDTIKVMPTVLCSAASSYYTINTAYNFQQPTIDTPPTSWTNWDKNAECTPPSRPAGFHLWVRVQVYSSSSTIMATYYFRVRLNAQSIHSWRMQFVNSDVNGNEPSLAPFRVTHGGELYAKHAHIEGEVIATSGTFTNGTFVSCTIQSATIIGGTWNTASITNVTINTATINNVTITNADVTGRITGSLRNPFMTVYDTFSAYDKDNLAMMTTASSWADVTLFSIPWDASQSGRLLRLCSYYWNGKDFPTEGWGRIQAPSGKYFYENGRKFKNLYFSREVVEIIGYGTSDTFYGWIVLNRTDIMTEKAYGMKNHCIAMGRVNGRTSTDTTVTCSAYRFDKQADPSTTMNITKVAEGVYKLTIPSSWKLTTSSIQVQLTPIGMIKGRDDIYLQNVGVKEFETSGGYVTGIVMYCSDDNSPNDGDFYYAIYNMEQYLQYHASGG